jgi:hypothetical protein
MSTVYTSINLTVPLAEARVRAADPETSSKIKRSINNELKKVRKAAEQVARQILWENTDTVTTTIISDAVSGAIEEYETEVNDLVEAATFEFDRKIETLVKQYGYDLCLAAVEADAVYDEANPDNARISMREVLKANDYHFNQTQEDQMDLIVERLEAEAKLVSYGVEFPDFELAPAPVEA